MRDIEFRGKRVDTGEWVYGNILACDDIVGQDSFIIPQNHFPSDFFAVDPETVGQYTGLKDKNGVKIFEGDIVKMYRSPYLGKPAVGKITWLHGGLWFEYTVPIYNPDKKRKAISGLFAFMRIPIEVIGNIHDTPELLTEASNG